MRDTTGRRLVYREMLYHARDRSVLELAASGAARRRSRQTSPTAGSYTRLQRELDRGAVQELRMTLVAIGGALQLLHDDPDIYSLCELCGAPISPARLHVMPWATRCDAHDGVTVH